MLTLYIYIYLSVSIDVRVYSFFYLSLTYGWIRNEISKKMIREKCLFQI